MRGGGGGEIGERRAGGDNSYNTHDRYQSTMVVAIVLWPPWGPTPGFQAYNINKHTMEEFYIVKTRKNFH
jgi:hypothetical protein